MNKKIFFAVLLIIINGGIYFLYKNSKLSFSLYQAQCNVPADIVIKKNNKKTEEGKCGKIFLLYKEGEYTVISKVAGRRSKVKELAVKNEYIVDNKIFRSYLKKIVHPNGSIVLNTDSLKAAVRNGDIGTIKYLLSHGVQINTDNIFDLVGASDHKMFNMFLKKKLESIGIRRLQKYKKNYYIYKKLTKFKFLKPDLYLLAMAKLHRDKKFIKYLYAHGVKSDAVLIKNADEMTVKSNYIYVFADINNINNKYSVSKLDMSGNVIKKINLSLKYPAKDVFFINKKSMKLYFIVKGSYPDLDIYEIDSELNKKVHKAAYFENGENRAVYYLLRHVFPTKNYYVFLFINTDKRKIVYAMFDKSKIKDYYNDFLIKYGSGSKRLDTIVFYDNNVFSSIIYSYKTDFYLNSSYLPLSKFKKINGYFYIYKFKNDYVLYNAKNKKIKKLLSYKNRLYYINSSHLYVFNKYGLNLLKNIDLYKYCQNNVNKNNEISISKYNAYIDNGTLWIEGKYNKNAILFKLEN